MRLPWTSYRYAVQRGKIRIEHDLAAADKEDGPVNPLDGNSGGLRGLTSRDSLHTIKNSRSRALAAILASTIAISASQGRSLGPAFTILVQREVRDRPNLPATCANREGARQVRAPVLPGPAPMMPGTVRKAWGHVQRCRGAVRALRGTPQRRRTVTHRSRRGDYCTNPLVRRMKAVSRLISSSLI